MGNALGLALGAVLHVGNELGDANGKWLAVGIALGAALGCELLLGAEEGALDGNWKPLLSVAVPPAGTSMVIGSTLQSGQLQEVACS